MLKEDVDAHIEGDPRNFLSPTEVMLEGYAKSEPSEPIGRGASLKKGKGRGHKIVGDPETLVGSRHFSSLIKPMSSPP